MTFFFLKNNGYFLFKNFLSWETLSFLKTNGQFSFKKITNKKLNY